MSTSDLDPEAILREDAFLRRLARSLTRDPGSADDLAQETWLALLSGDGTPRGSLRGFLTGAVRNVAGKGRRSEGRRARREARRAAPPGPSSPEEILAREELRQRLVREVLALDEATRSAMVQRYFDDLPPRVIATRAGVPVETVRTRIKRGLAVLRARLDAEAGGRSTWVGLLVPLTPSPLSARPGLELVTVMSLSSKLALVLVPTLLVAWIWSARGATPRAVDTTGLASTPAPAEPVALPETPVERQDATLADTPRAAPKSTPAQLAATTGRLDVRIEWERDGSPAAGIGLRLEPASAAEPWHLSVEGETDAEGRFRADALDPGRWSVRVDRLGLREALVRGGETSALVLRLPRGFDVAGRVVSRAGTPVAGAEVWISSGDLDAAFVAATSAGDGAFHLRSLAGPHSVWARARGHAPSLARRLVAGDGASLPVELVLSGPGGPIRGLVRGPNGAPVAGALVVAGERDGDWTSFEAQRSDADGKRRIDGRREPRTRTRSDDQGVFELTGNAPGPLVLCVRSPGFGTWRGEAFVLEGAPTSVDVLLDAGSVLEGQASSVLGGALAGARVVAGEPPFLERAATSDATGRYRLTGLAAGATDVRATHTDASATAARLVLEPGSTAVWDPVLGDDRSLAGRLVDETGAPLAEWLVVLGDVRPPSDAARDFRAVQSDAHGAFRFDDLAPRPHRLEAAPGDNPSATAVTLDWIEPEERWLELVVDEDDLPRATIRGRVVDAAGEPLLGAIFTAFREGADLTWESRAEEGSAAFELGPYPDGTWTLLVRAADLPQRTLGPYPLEGTETWDLGDVALRQGGRVEAVFVREGVAKSISPNVELRVGGRVLSSPLTVDAEGVRTLALAPGDYALRVSGPGLAMRSTPFTIVGGESLALELIVAPGVPVQLVVEDPSEITPHPSLDAQLMDAAGASLEVELLREGPGLYAGTVFLAAGRHEVHVRAPAIGGAMSLMVGVGARFEAALGMQPVVLRFP